MTNNITRKIIISAAVVLAAAAMSGCVEREIVKNPEQVVPDMTIRDDIDIDWDQVMSDCEELLNQDDYPKGKYLDFVSHEETDTAEACTEIIWPVSEDITDEEAIEYAKAYAKAFNDAVATQDFSYALSSDDSYGGYWDKNNMYVQVFRESDILSSENYLVNQFIHAGTNEPVVLQNESN